MANPRAAGYEWALGHAPNTEYQELQSYAAFSQQFPAIDDLDSQHELFEQWERGADDSGIFIREDSYLSISECAARAGCGRQYVKDEVRRGNLPAMKVGKQFIIHPDDFQKWMKNPSRGTRAK